MSRVDVVRPGALLFDRAALTFPKCSDSLASDPWQSPRGTAQHHNITLQNRASLQSLSLGDCREARFWPTLPIVTPTTNSDLDCYGSHPKVVFN